MWEFIVFWFSVYGNTKHVSMCHISWSIFVLHFLSCTSYVQRCHVIVLSQNLPLVKTNPKFSVNQTGKYQKSHWNFKFSAVTRTTYLGSKIFGFLDNRYNRGSSIFTSSSLFFSDSQTRRWWNFSTISIVTSDFWKLSRPPPKVRKWKYCHSWEPCTVCA